MIMNSRMAKLPVLLAMVCAGSSFSAELPDLVFPAGVGVNIHFTRGHERDLDKIAEAGFKFIRMDFGWAATERRKGEYDWSEYDELTANLDKRGIRALYILDYSNPLYEEVVVSRNPINGQEHRDTGSPQHAESVAAFARWAAAAALHFKGRHIIWEIWNEPNISFWKPRPDVGQYATLALATCKAVRDADPAATIVGPATSEFPWEFLEAFFKTGALEHLDAVSVHPYRSKSKPPETAAEEYRKLRALIEKYASGEARRKLPILSGEWGYSSHAKGVTLDAQAAFLARQQLINVFSGVRISIWYDWKNDGPDANENEHNFGTVTPGLEPKPAYMAIKTLTRELTGFRLARRLDQPADTDMVYLLINGSGHRKLVAWTTGEAHSTTIELGRGVFKSIIVTSGTGENLAAGVEGNSLKLQLAALPQYVTLK